ncbi:MAG: GDSL-type esterase/lipase family protein [Planctomycetota bacterium]|nr:GDSL-type esterase/lipase family protein [Planctomycetota bacterium]
MASKDPSTSGGRGPSPRRRGWRRLVALAAGLALGLLVAEVAVRVVLDPHGRAVAAARAKLPRWRALLEAGLFEATDTAGLQYRLRPGFEAQVLGVRYRTNSLGMRGPEVAATAPPGTRRVLLVGDSYAYGLGVPESATLSAQLEQLLDEDQRDVEVLNLGVPAYQTSQELAWLEARGFGLAPDLVVLLHFGNDASEPAYLHDDTRRLLYTDELPLPFALKRALWSSALYVLAAEASADTYARSGAFTAGEGATWPAVSARLEALFAACAEHRLPLVVANLPTIRPGAITADPRAFAPDLVDAARVTSLAAQHAIPVIELGPLLVQRARAGQLDALLIDRAPGPRYDDHLTPEGNRLLAEHLATELRSQLAR